MPEMLGHTRVKDGGIDGKTDGTAEGSAGEHETTSDGDQFRWSAELRGGDKESERPAEAETQDGGVPPNRVVAGESGPGH